MKRFPLVSFRQYHPDVIVMLVFRGWIHIIIISRIHTIFSYKNQNIPFLSNVSVLISRHYRDRETDQYHSLALT
jgi:hypothetical protein